MNIKTDTKEKFHVITLLDSTISATMTAELRECLLPYIQNDVKNIILKLDNTNSIDMEAAQELTLIQQTFYENGASFVLCGLKKDIEHFLDENELLDVLNITPTESEAWDIVQMEEIERELGF